MNGSNGFFHSFVLFLFGLAFAAFGVIVAGFEDLKSISEGLVKIIEAPDYLLTDYIQIGGLPAAFLNAGTLMILFACILKLLKMPITGLSYAAILSIGGFALFGKNLFNVWPIPLGVLLYSLYKKEPVQRYIYIGFFGTALSPFVSYLAFTLNTNLLMRLTVSYLTGIVIGFFLPSLASYFLTLHKGYNLYNVGFTCGLMGTMVVALMRTYGVKVPPQSIWSEGNNSILSVFLFTLFGVVFFIGWSLNGKSWKGYGKLMRHSGRLLTDFVILEGLPLTLINVGILGVIATLYILAVGSELNGPTIGAIMTVAGFAAFGKHPRNSLPVMVGVTLATITNSFKLASPNNVLAALFGTAMGPIAGEFGVVWGVVAGFLHNAIVNNVGFLHAGFNLYNNGFAAGLVSIFLIPVIKAVHKREDL